VAENPGGGERNAEPRDLAQVSSRQAAAETRRHAHEAGSERNKSRCESRGKFPWYPGKVGEEFQRQREKKRSSAVKRENVQ